MSLSIVKRFWIDDDGAVVSAELVLIASILVLGMVVGLATLREHVVQELGDFAAALAQVQQTYSFSGITGHNSRVAGTDFVDQPDECQTVFIDDPAGEGPLEIGVSELAQEEGG